MENKYIIDEEKQGKRIDVIVSEIEEKISRSLAQSMIKEGKILLNGEKTKASTKVQVGQELSIEMCLEERSKIEAEDIDIDILYEDDDIIVVNKPKNMVVHPAVGNKSGTLVNAILGKHELSDLNGEIRPGIVHRLDKNTTGVLIVAKNNYAHQKIANQIQNRETKKTYIALVRGVISENNAEINMPIGRHPTDRKKMAVVKGGKEALTKFKVLKRFKQGYTLLEIDLKTGRTHQIRVHMSHIGYPIVGDDVYSNGKNEFGVTSQMLHAYKISFCHPTRNEMMEFVAPLPDELKKIIDNLDEL